MGHYQIRFTCNYLCVANGTDTITRTMGIISSRALLRESHPPRAREIYPRGEVSPIAETDRLVRDKLCEEIQCSVYHQEPKARNCLSVIQVAPKGVQQEDVRPILSLEAYKVPRHGNNGRATKLF